MRTHRLALWKAVLCALLAVAALAAAAQADDDTPSESQCRPYIEKALKELESGDTEPDSVEKNDSSEVSVDDSDDTKEVDSSENEARHSKEDDEPSLEIADEPYVQASVEDLTTDDNNSKENTAAEDQNDDSAEDTNDSRQDDDADSKEDISADEQTAEQESKEESGEAKEKEVEGDESSEDNTREATDEDDKSTESSITHDKNNEDDDDHENTTKEDDDESQEKADESQEETDSQEGDNSQERDDESKEDEDESEENVATRQDKDDSEEEINSDEEKNDSDEKVEKSSVAEEGMDLSQEQGESKEDDEEGGDEDTSEEMEHSKESADEGSEDEEAPEEELLLVGDIPENLRSRDHIIQILRLDQEASEAELTVEKSADIILRDLKRLYENSIKPLEGLYKYRDLSNRHFGDPEIFSKPLVLFMGPWSGGKSSILNYLTGLEFTEWSLRTGAEPSPAYFNILMHGKDPEVLDGTQLAADWTFSGLQKFGQGLEERLRGLKYPSKILEKVNIVEIPGILEVRKQVSRIFPFNDACQWFIDRADIIFLVYDPSKLDVGPETEAILDQLKGRESQTRIVLNKADSVKPEELMRVQSALIWNISPLMSSAQPPLMYAVSLWSMPYEPGAPVRLLQAQERELLRDLRQAVDRRIENKIASARRFAVRVRNHAKMVDCYLTTYYNHKTIFGNRKLIADAIIENPQNYHIYEGLSTLTNISRYDLPDPDSYRDFFRLNPLYEFSPLSATCTYFRGCPINQLDVAIAYDLPELVGKYKKMVESATPQGMPKS